MKTCPDCRGQFDTCSTCHGTGLVDDTAQMWVLVDHVDIAYACATSSDPEQLKRYAVQQVLGGQEQLHWHKRAMRWVSDDVGPNDAHFTIEKVDHV